MTPDSYGLQIALTAVALLLAALGAVLLSRDARGDAPAASLDLTDARVRLGDGASVLRFRLEVQPSGRTTSAPRRAPAASRSKRGCFR